jgi:NADPH:quinone reductase-like Zn-dependent oxidoreductase
MKAITQDRYGGPEVLEFRDIDQPVPTDNQVLSRSRPPAPIGATGTS